MPVKMCFSCQGKGVHPHADPWRRAFSKAYHPDRFKVAGTPLAQGFVGVFDGIQSDWEFAKKIFNLQRSLGNIQETFRFVRRPIGQFYSLPEPLALRRLFSQTGLLFLRGTHT